MEVEGQETVPVSSSDGWDSLNCLCLVCGDCVKIREKSQMEVAPILLELFRVFSKYMQWAMPSRNRFDFEDELFPFCKPCKSAVIKVFNLNEQIRELLSEIRQLIINTSVKILHSQEVQVSKVSHERDSSRYKCDFDNTRNVELTCNDGSKLQYTATKIKFYRRETLNRYLPTIPCENVNPSSRLEPSDKYNVDRPESRSKTCVQNGEEEPETFRPTPKTHRKKPKSAIFMGRLKNRVRQLGDGEFIFDEKYPFCRLPSNNWECSTCRAQFSNAQGVLLENHLLMGCPGPSPTSIMRPKPPDIMIEAEILPARKSDQERSSASQNGTPVSVSEATIDAEFVNLFRTARSKKNYPVPVEKDKYMYGKFFFRHINGKDDIPPHFQCCHCSFTGRSKQQFVDHIDLDHRKQDTFRRGKAAEKVQRTYAASAKKPQPTTETISAITSPVYPHPSKNTSANFSKQNYPIQIGKTRFTFHGFEFEAVEGTGDYKCCHCYFTEARKAKFMDHIRSEHENQKSTRTTWVSSGGVNNNVSTLQAFSTNLPKHPKLSDGSCVQNDRNTTGRGNENNNVLPMELTSGVPTVSASTSYAVKNKPQPCAELWPKRKDAILYEFRGYTFAELGNEIYKCLHCSFVADAKKRLIEHISVDHNVPKNSTTPAVGALGSDATSKPTDVSFYTCDPIPASVLYLTDNLQFSSANSEDILSQMQMNITSQMTNTASLSTVAKIDKLMCSSRIKDKLERVGFNSFCYDRQYSFELRAENGSLRWACLNCNRFSSQSELDLENHMMFHEALVGQKRSKIQDILLGKLRGHLFQVSHKQFIYQNMYHFELTENGQWCCSTCSGQYLTTLAMEQHLARGCQGNPYFVGRNVNEYQNQGSSIQHNEDIMCTADDNFVTESPVPFDFPADEEEQPFEEITDGKFMIEGMDVEILPN